MKLLILNAIFIPLVILPLVSCSIKGGEVTSEVFNSKAYETLSEVTLTGFTPGTIQYTQSNLLQLSGQCLSGATIIIVGDVSEQFSCQSGQFSVTVAATKIGLMKFKIYQQKSIERSAGIDFQWFRDHIPPTVTTWNDGMAASLTSSPNYSLNVSDSHSGIDKIEVAVVTDIADLDDPSIVWLEINKNATSGSVVGTYSQNVTYYTLIKVRDIAGNTSIAAGDGWSVINPPVVTSPITLSIQSNTNTISISGECLSGTTVTLDDTDDQSQLCVADHFSFSISKATDGQYTFSISQFYDDALSNSVDVVWLRDQTAPTFTGTLDDGVNTINSTVSPSFNFTSATDGGGTGIDHYEVAVGTSPGASDVVDWGDIGMVTTGTVNGTYVYGSTYYTTIKAIDEVGNESLLQGNGWTYLYSVPDLSNLPSSVPEAFPYSGTVSVLYPLGGESFALDSSTCPGLEINSNSGYIYGVIGVTNGGSCQFKVKVMYSGGYHLSELKTLNFTTSLAMSFSTDFVDVKKGDAAQTVNLQLATPAPFTTTIEYKIYSFSNEYTLLNAFAGTGYITIAQGASSVPLNIEFLSANSFSDIDVQSLQIDSGAKSKPTLGLRFHQGLALPQFSVVSTSKTSGFSCGISNQQLYCWGDNNYGQLGLGHMLDQKNPKRVDAGVMYTNVSVGGMHACAIALSGKLKCWGYNNYGQVGNETTTTQLTPVEIDSTNDFLSISLGYQHTCAVTINNQLKCWGLNNFGQLGNNATSSMANAYPIAIDTSFAYQSVSSGYHHNCALTMTGAMKCWGLNTHGQLGNSSTVQSNRPILIDSLFTYQSVSTGVNHTCGIVVGGSLKCWGLNSSGQLGNNTIDPSSVPVEINTGTNYQSISAGFNHTCAVVAGGQLQCWGSNLFGQVGDGTTESKKIPQVINSAISYQSVSVGLNSSCAINNDSVLECWGDNSQQQLGLSVSNSTQDFKHTIPHQQFIKAELGNYNSCAISSNNKLYCWGLNGNGQLGDGTVITRTNPIWIDAGTSYQQISSGSYSSCGITTEGTLKCWGYNYFGQLGDGTNVQAASPQLIDSGTSYQMISVGEKHACGITIAGVLKCWGDNTHGQLGNGDNISQWTPTPILGSFAYQFVAVGANHTCAITTLGLLKCWGMNNYSQLGDSSTINRSTPADIDQTQTYLKVAAGFNHTCAITTDLDLKCWGYNTSGQVGNGTTSTQSLPAVINTYGDVESISVGGATSCAVNVGGELRCWGSNIQGQFGNGTSVNQTAPVLIDAGIAYQNVWTGLSHTCAILATSPDNGKLKCWGANTYGQTLGILSFVNRPRQVIKLEP